jgi:hypothetical protein
VVKSLLYRRHVSTLVLGHHQVSKICKKKKLYIVCLRVIVHNNLKRDLFGLSAGGQYGLATKAVYIINMHKSQTYKGVDTSRMNNSNIKIK